MVRRSILTLLLIGAALNGWPCESPRATGSPSRSTALEMPSDWGDESVLPSIYLSELQVDPSWELDDCERNQLEELVIAANEFSIREFEQSYYMPATTLFWQLVLKNYPEVAGIESEDGELIYLGRLAKFFADRRT